MSIYGYRARCLCTLLILGITLAGCEKISSVVEYFKGDKAKVSAQSGQTAPPVMKNSPPVMKPNTLARVGNWSITVEEFNDRLSALKEIAPEYDTSDPEMKKLVLEELVNQQVLVNGAEQSGLANEKDIAAAVDEFRRTLIVREVARVLSEGISVTEQEARDFYDQNKEALIGDAEWHVREIVVPTKEQASDLLSQILAGADFAATARQFSTGTTAANGGDMGFITEEPFPQMGNALLSLETGDVSGVFKGPDGYYIVKLEEKRDGQQIPFDEIKDDIIQSQTLLKQQEKILNHLNTLKEKIPVEINDGLL